ncbi:MAG: hypothetical protein QXT43_01470, partial [Candidatus Micrarchaeaceae archaeon]
MGDFMARFKGFTPEELKKFDSNLEALREKINKETNRSAEMLFELNDETKKAARPSVYHAYVSHRVKKHPIKPREEQHVYPDSFEDALQLLGKNLSAS